MKRTLMTSIIVGLASQLVAGSSLVQATTGQTTTGQTQKPPVQGTSTTTAAGTATPAAAAATSPTAQPYDYTFPSGMGMLFFYVKPDKGPNFEAVVTKIKEILDTSTDTTRRQQAAGWKIYKSLEAPKEGLIYVFLFDPAIVGVDYDPVKVLSQALPTELQGLYDRLVDALIRVERMGLAKIR